MLFQNCRSSRPEVFCKKGVLKNFEIFTGKHLCQSFFFNKVAGLRCPTLLKKRLWHRCFPMYIAKFLRKSSVMEYLWWLLLHHSAGNLSHDISNKVFINEHYQIVEIVLEWLKTQQKVILISTNMLLLQNKSFFYGKRFQNFRAIFFISHLAAPKLTLGHIRGNSLTHSILSVSCCSFPLRVTRIFVAKLGP